MELTGAVGKGQWTVTPLIGMRKDDATELLFFFRQTPIQVFIFHSIIIVVVIIVIMTTISISSFKFSFRILSRNVVIEKISLNLRLPAESARSSTELVKNAVLSATSPLLNLATPGKKTRFLIFCMGEGLERGRGGGARHFGTVVEEQKCWWRHPHMSEEWKNVDNIKEGSHRKQRLSQGNVVARGGIWSREFHSGTGRNETKSSRMI